MRCFLNRNGRSTLSKWHALILLVGVGWLFLGGYPYTAEAHTEGKMQLASVPAGPFKLTVWTYPDPARTAELHVAVAVVSAEDASPVLDAGVLVQLVPTNDGDPTYSATATTEDSTNKFLYEAILEPSEAGTYLVNIHISGSDGEMGDVSFELEVLSGSGFNWLLLLPIVLGGAAILLLWLALRQRATAG